MSRPALGFRGDPGGETKCPTVLADAYVFLRQYRHPNTPKLPRHLGANTLVYCAVVRIMSLRFNRNPHESGVTDAALGSTGSGSTHLRAGVAFLKERKTPIGL